MEKLVPGIGAGMAILTAVRDTHFRMTGHAAEMIRSFQSDFVPVIQGVVSVNSVKVFSFEPFA
jgi:hypothetical protein